MKLPIRKQYLKELINHGARKKPCVLQLPITSRCNSHCVTCGVYNNHEKYDIDPSLLRIALSDPFFSDVTTVGLNGGEFTLVKSFFQIIDAVLSLPKISTIYLITNGLLPERLFELLQKTKQICVSHNVRLHLCLSVDGFGAVHELVRGIKGCFSKTTQVLDEMKKNLDLYCHSFSVGCTISIYNIEYIWQTYQYLSDFSFPVEYHLAVPNKRIGVFEDSKFYVLNDEKSRLLAAEFFYILYLRAADDESKFQYFTNYVFLKTGGRKRLCECSFLNRDVTIDERLNFYLCATASNSVGNLTQRSASQLLHQGLLDKEAKRLSSNCNSCIHYSYNKHTFWGRISFVLDYVPRQFTYQRFELYSKKKNLKTLKQIVKLYFNMLRMSVFYLRKL